MSGGPATGNLVVSLDEDEVENRLKQRNGDDNRIIPSAGLRQYSNGRPTPPSSARHSLVGVSSKRWSTASDHFVDADDFSSTRSITPSAGLHSRSNSTRRKPVPSFLPAPNVSLPSSHPFAHGIIPLDPHSNPESPSAIAGNDLFYSPAKRGSPVPPPRRPLSAAYIGGKAEGSGESGSGSEQEGSNTDMSAKRRSHLARTDMNKEAPIPSRSSSLHGKVPLASVSPVQPSKTLSRTGTPAPEDKALPPPPESNGAASPVTPTVSTDSPVAPQTPHAAESELVALTPIIDDPEKTPRQQNIWSGTLGTPINAKSGSQRLTKNFGAPLEKPAAEEPAASPTNERRVSLFPGGEAPEDETFSVDRAPSKRRLWEAGTLFVRDEDGNPFCVGDLFPKYPTLEEQEASQKPLPKTVLMFIRNWGCGQCQDYLFASVSQLDPEALEKANVKVAIIGCGGWKTIKPYRKLFKCPFPIYTDSTRRLYTLMGMIKYTNNFGPWFKGRPAYHQRPVPTQVIHGISNMIKHMPLGNPGKLTQLGGEFILSPGFKCEFAHRMTNTSNHMEAPEVMRLAGVPYPTKAEAAEARQDVEQQLELARMQEEMTTWRKGREAELERIRRKKAARRGEAYKPATRASMIGLGLDEELDELEQAGVEGDGDRPNGHTNGDYEFNGDQAEEDDAGLVCAMPDRDGGAEEILLDDSVEQGSDYEVDLELSSLHRLNSEELDRRFSAALKLEEQREKELVAAGELRERENGVVEMKSH